MPNTIALGFDNHFVVLDHFKADILDMSNQSQDEQALESIRLFTSMADMLIRLTNNFKVNVVSLFKSFKRSELRMYKESHAITSRQLLASTAIDLHTYQVVIPEGMKVPYSDASKKLLDMISKIELNRLTKSAFVYLNLFTNRTPDEYRNLTKETVLAIDQINMVTKADVEKTLNTIFESRPNSNKIVKCSDVIRNMKELNFVFNEILKFELVYVELSSKIKEIENIEAKVGAVVKRIQNVQFLDQKFLELFHTFVYTLAVQFDMYGAIIHEMQRVEHNFVLSFDVLMNAYIDSEK